MGDYLLSSTDSNNAMYYKQIYLETEFYESVIHPRSLSRLIKEEL